MNDVLRYVSSKLQEELKSIESDIVMGGAQDYGAYRYTCGVYRGLLMANNIIMQTSERIEKGDDED